ncbi:MAG: hypothetical protein E7449_06825 [Ruminococcaceae bacterium]|nr:hypothetical protein [Oscillospiraceae bacterium]
MRAKGLEIFKNIVIVLLALSVVVLAITVYSDSTLSGAENLQQLQQRLTLLFRDESYRLEYASESLSATTAAKPTVISVRNSFGRQTTRYDADALERAYEALGGLLGEALETAGTPEEVRTVSWRAALQQNGIYYVYSDPLPTTLLSGWLEVQGNLRAITDRLVLCQEVDGIFLYYATESSYLRARTSVDAARFTELVEACRPDGSAFVLELDSDAYNRLDKETLLSMRTAASIPDVRAENPVDSALVTHLASLFSFNPYGNSYTTSEGTQIYEESTRSLSIAADGTLIVRNSGTQDTRFLAETDSDEALVEYARALLEEICGDTRADARLQLTGLVRSGSEVSLTFDYFVGGIRVQSGANSAARLLFSGNRLSELRTLLRTYTLTGTAQSLLPERQTAAIVAKGTRLMLCYSDRGAEMLSAGWNRE